MSPEYPKPMARLVEAFRKLPGIGPRSARRMAWHIVELPYDEAVELARALVLVKKSIKPCPECYNYTDSEPCEICADAARDKGRICVVEAPEDVAAFERAGGHNGVYHVLGGSLNPSSGKGPDKIRAAELLKRVETTAPSEIIIATNPTAQGEATAAYIARMLKPTGVRITRPARGIPAGADMDALDNDTLSDAMHSRRDYSSGD